MNENKSTGNKMVQNDKILESLIEDPTKSVREIAKELNTYRQKVWRRKKKLEDEKVIWGYTAVVDDSKLNYVSYIILLKTKTMSKDLVDILIRRLTRNEPRRQGVHLKNMCYVNGEYDWIIRFSAPDHATARKYYETLRLLYSKHLVEKPVMVDVNFCLVAEGKNNPNMKKLYDYVPELKDSGITLE